MRMEDSKRSKRPHTFCRNNFQSLGWSPSTPLAPLISIYTMTHITLFVQKTTAKFKKKTWIAWPGRLDRTILWEET